MSRILAFSDLHCGSGADYVDDRLADHERTLEQIVEIAKARDVSLVVLAGDIFHRPRPAPDVMHVFRRFAHGLANAGIPAVAVHGNLSHDIENGDRPSALELFASPLFHVFRHPGVLEIAGITVCALPSVPVHRLVAGRNGGDRHQVFTDAAELLVGIAAELRAQAAPDRPAVLLTHFAISGASLPTGLPTDTLNEPVVPLGDLEQLGFSAVVAGHIHQPQLIESAPFVSTTPTFYTGSPLCLNFGEAHVDHGVWILGVGEFAEAPEFVPLEGRRFVTVDVDLTAIESDAAAGLDETDIVAAYIAEQLPLTDAIIRVRYRASEEQHRRVDRDALKRLCLDAGAARVYQIVPEIIRSSRARAAHVDETLEPLDALDAWVTANAIDDEKAEPLRELTRTLLSEEVTA